MEWDTNPLLREEIAAPKRGKASHYAWSDVMGVSVLSYRGHPIGRVHANGQYTLHWRGRLHEGKAGSAKQARRFMGRWIAKRGLQSPMLDDHSPPSTLVPLTDFLRDYESGKF